MKRKSDLEAAKERRRAYHARRYADPEYRARMQEYARNRLAEKRADPDWHAEFKKKQRRYYRTKGKFLPNRKLSRQPAYSKLAANPEWRQRHNAKQRERYHNDRAFRARTLARQRWLYRAKRTAAAASVTTSAPAACAPSIPSLRPWPPPRAGARSLRAHVPSRSFRWTNVHP
jgi:hypothetical protein